MEKEFFKTIINYKCTIDVEILLNLIYLIIIHYIFNLFFDIYNLLL